MKTNAKRSAKTATQPREKRAATKGTSEDAASPRVGLKAPPAEVEFHGLFKVRLLLGMDDRRHVVVNDVADAHGLRRAPLRARVQRQFPQGCSIMELPSAGGPQDVLTLDLRCLPGLLMGIDVERCRAEIRPRLKEIRDELTEALAAYTFEGAAINPAFAARLPAGPSSAPLGPLGALADVLLRIERTENAALGALTAQIGDLSEQIRELRAASLPSPPPLSPGRLEILRFVEQQNKAGKGCEMQEMIGASFLSAGAARKLVEGLMALGLIEDRNKDSGARASSFWLLSAAAVHLKNAPLPPTPSAAPSPPPPPFALPPRPLSGAQRALRERQDVEAARRRVKVLAWIKEQNAKEKGATMDDLFQGMKMKPNAIRRAVVYMLKEGTIEDRNRQTNRRMMLLWIVVPSANASADAI